MDYVFHSLLYVLIFSTYSVFIDFDADVIKIERIIRSNKFKRKSSITLTGHCPKYLSPLYSGT
jgi:hypothetical protein